MGVAGEGSQCEKRNLRLQIETFERKITGAPRETSILGRSPYVTHCATVRRGSLQQRCVSARVRDAANADSDIFVKPNAKRPGTASGKRYAKYQAVNSVSQYLKLGGTRSDLAHDLKKGIVTAKATVLDDDDGAPDLAAASDSDVVRETRAKVGDPEGKAPYAIVRLRVLV